MNISLHPQHGKFIWIQKTCSNFWLQLGWKGEVSCLSQVKSGKEIQIQSWISKIRWTVSRDFASFPVNRLQSSKTKESTQHTFMTTIGKREPFTIRWIVYQVCYYRSYNTSKTTECRAKTNGEGSAVCREQFGCEREYSVKSHRSEELAEKRTNHLKNRCIWKPM